MNNAKFVLETVMALDAAGRVEFEETPFGTGAVVFSGKIHTRSRAQCAVIMPDLVREGGLPPPEAMS